MFDGDGVLRAARYVPSPNCDARPAGTEVTLLVVHCISLPRGVYRGDAIERLFTNRLRREEHPTFASLAGLRVAAHFLLRRNGELVQFVPIHRRAWHAGASRWRGRERCNDFSIGVELEGVDDDVFRRAQYAALATLLGALRGVLPLREVAAHSDISPGRKTDPGPAFDWSALLNRLARC